MSIINMKLIIFQILVLLKCTSVYCTTRPIIGIMAQEFAEYRAGGSINPVGSSYIAASYVKAIESSGARVVPILTNQSYHYYERILHSINGVVAPGGSNEIQPGCPYYDTFVTIIKIAEQMNNKGIYFPIMGMCWGFEALFTIYNNHKLLQTSCDAYHQNYALHFEPKFTQSLLFSNIDHQTYVRLKYFPITAHAHDWCTTQRNFTNSRLSKYWKVTSTSVTSRGLKFISSAEHKKYPFIALQFHPEKPTFEWEEWLNLPHNHVVVQANRHFYDVLVKLAKLNNNKFRTEKEEKDALIYNYRPFYPVTKPAIFTQVYIFN
ncbi:gamma-glutamyl hydrolase A-like [Planococcus citri]|uniref:gamma-glutamyl hydrolase A-like n=1 Tax=Planococcus citri TaxID=170843 RepID=UPI0031F8460D